MVAPHSYGKAEFSILAAVGEDDRAEDTGQPSAVAITSSGYTEAQVAAIITLSLARRLSMCTLLL